MPQQQTLRCSESQLTSQVALLGVSMSTQDAFTAGLSLIGSKGTPAYAEGTSAAFLAPPVAFAGVGANGLDAITVSLQRTKQLLSLLIEVDTHSQRCALRTDSSVCLCAANPPHSVLLLQVLHNSEHGLTDNNGRLARGFCCGSSHCRSLLQVFNNALSQRNLPRIHCCGRGVVGSCCGGCAPLRVQTMHRPC